MIKKLIDNTLPLPNSTKDNKEVLMIENYLKPFSSKHSIREAVISVFLANPIIKPERFQKLIENGFFNDEFQAFETVGAVEIELKQGNTGMIEQTAQNMSNVGFKFIGFSQGKVSRILQGVNERGRTFISYHCFSYTRWNDFLDDYLRFIKILSTSQTEMFINAVSIHYIDQFRWVSQSPINLSKIFNNHTRYLSKALLETDGPTNFIFNNQSIVDSCIHFDRLEIKVDDKNSKDISISHNVTKRLDDLKGLEALCNSEIEYFKHILFELHKGNKILLDDILEKEVKKMINLPSKQE